MDVLPTPLLVGAGLGLVFAPSFTLGTFGVGPGDAGVASATVNVAQQIGGPIGTSLLNTISTTVAAGYVAAHIATAASAAGRKLVEANSLLDSYHTVFWVAAGIYVGVAVLTALLLRSGLALTEDSDTAAEPA